MNQRLIYLASTSPRRRELLRQIGVLFRIHTLPVDESHTPGEAPGELVARLALHKAEAAWRDLGEPGAHPVIGADTAVALEGEIFGKPRDRDHALHMLGRLSGATHEVYSAVACVCTAFREARLSRSKVSFREISPAECERYWDSGEPADKAGAYALQGRAAVFVSRLEGSYSGVIGLPLFDTAGLLEQAGFPVLAP